MNATKKVRACRVCQRANVIDNLPNMAAPRVTSMPLKVWKQNIADYYAIRPNQQGSREHSFVANDSRGNQHASLVIYVMKHCSVGG